MDKEMTVELIAFPDANQHLEGRANQGVMVIMAGEAKEIEPDKAYLTNILKAAQLTPIEEKVAFLAVSPHQSIPLVQLMQAAQCHTALIFGLPPAQAGLQAALQPYVATRLAGYTFLWSHSPATISADRARNDNTKAGALWQALKTLFL